MANLRTNNLCGEGGRNAYNGSVFFGSQYTFLQLDGSSDFAFGTSDFTIEMWIKIDDDTNTNSIYDSRPSGSNGAQIALFYSGSSNAILFAHGGTVRITGTIDVGVDRSWHHIALTRASGSTKLFVDGVQDGSTYSDSTSYLNPADRPLIGQSGGSTNLAADTFFKGYISNLRVCAGHAVYTANFTPPTSPLTVHHIADDDKTVLLCCQDSDDPTQEATGKTIVANGLTSLVNRTDNLIKNGRFTFSATENWTLSGGTAALGTGQSGTFGDGNHLVLTASSSSAYLKQAFTTVVGRTYLVNVQSNGGDASFISTSTSESDAVITDIRSTTQTADGRAAEKNFVATQTTYYMILRGNTGGANFDSASVYEQENRVPPKVTPPYGVDAGNTFGGVISMNTPSYMYFPTGRTEERGRGRALIAGGSTPSVTSNINFLNIQSSGKSIDFGDLTHGRYDMSGCSNGNRGVFAGGRDPAGDELDDTIDFVTIATTANAIDFGNLTASRGGTQGAVSSSTRGIWGGGFEPSQVNKIEFVTLATIGNSTDFGDLTVARNGCGRAMSPTRGLFGGGGTPTANDTIDYITMATAGNAQDFGNLTATVANSVQGTSSNTRGIFGGMGPNFDTIDFVTIASTGNATDFGDLVVDAQQRTATGNTIRGIFMGGYISPTGRSTIIDQIEIATTGSAASFGDLLTTTSFAGSTSDSHGGLS